MDSAQKSTTVADVPTQVFQKFLDAVTPVGASSEMVERLKQALLVDGDFTEDGLKAAIFGEEAADD